MKQSVPYCLGLDTGVENAGHAAIDENFNILKYRHKKEIGVTQFRKADTAQSRRTFRAARRRYHHRKWRLKQFEKYMAPYFAEQGIDYQEYFRAFHNSWVSPKDPHRKQLRFNTELNRYPTRYHAMAALIENDKDLPTDPAKKLELIFEVIHPLIKYRGHFLDFEEVESFRVSELNYQSTLNELNEKLQKVGSETEHKATFSISTSNASKIESVINNPNHSNDEKCDQLKELLTVSSLNSKDKQINNRIKETISQLIVGKNISSINKLQELFNYHDDIQVLDPDKGTFKKFKDFSFGDSDVQDKLDAMRNVYSVNSIALLDCLYKIYRQIKLKDLVPFSKKKVESYDIFQKQLKKYKAVLKTIPNPKTVAYLKQQLNEYLYFKRRSSGSIDYTTFIKNIRQGTKSLKPYDGKNKYAHDILEDIKKGSFLRKQRSLDNGNIPHQIMQLELRRIIETQSKVPGFEWLAKNDQTNDHEKYNLERFIDFRAPYYVGPLDKDHSSEFSWVCFKDNKKIPLTIWNFDERIDFGKTINNFIRRMTATDTYLLGEAVLPASSLLYQKYEVLNELNKIKIQGKNISVKEKQALYNDLFVRAEDDSNKVKLSSVCHYLNAHFEKYHNDLKPNQIKGVSGGTKFNSFLSTYHDLKQSITDLIDDPKWQDDIEAIIEILTVFNKDTVQIKKDEISKLRIAQSKSFPLDKIARKQYKGWGHLSKKLLVELKSNGALKDKKNHSILDILWLTNYNFNQIINWQEFKKQINQFNREFTEGETRQAKINRILQYSRISPYDARSIRQLIAIVDDYVKFNHRSPQMIALEFARGKETNANNAPKYVRIERLLKNTVAKIEWDQRLKKEFKSFKSTKKQKDFGIKEYLYFTQNGKDIYDGKSINIDELDNYDIDHIFPKSTGFRDDSIDNKALTSAHNNRAVKKNKPAIQVFARQKAFWKYLNDCRLISDKKYKRLTFDWTSKEADEHQKLGMMARSLVDTRAVTKITTQILTELYPETKIVAVNANLSKQLRNKFHLPKVRDVNDYHHAVDAYLAAFDAVYMWKLYPTLRPLLDYNDHLFAKDVKDIDLSKFGFASLFDSKNEVEVIVNKYGEIVGNRSQIVKKLKSLANPKWISVIYRHSEKGNKGGALFKQTINKANNSKKAINLKRNLDPSLYGYYCTPFSKYMMLIKYDEKYKVVNVPNGFNIKNKATTDKLIKQQCGASNYRILINRLLPFTMAQNIAKVGKERFEMHYLINSADGPTNYDQLWLPEKTMGLLEELNKNSNNICQVSNVIKKLNYIFTDICKYISIRIPMVSTKQDGWKILLDNKASFIKAGDHKEDVLNKYSDIVGLLKAAHADSGRFYSSNAKLLNFTGKLGYSRSWPLNDETQLIFTSPACLHKKYVRLGDL